MGYYAYTLPDDETGEPRRMFGVGMVELNETEARELNAWLSDVLDAPTDADA